MNQTLKAVHDADLEGVLRGLDILHDFTVGKLTCKFCADVITTENLHAIFPESGSVKLSCDRPPCVIALATKVAEGRLSAAS
jgi:hypothetical protein